MSTALLVVVLASVQPIVDVEPLSGQSLRGTLVQLDGQGVTLETPKGRVAVEIDRLAGISLAPSPTPAAPAAQPEVWVELIDGSLIVGTGFTVKDGKASLAPLGPEAARCEISTQDIRSVRFQAQSEALSAQWEKVLASEARTDVLVTRKGDVLDFYQGVAKNVTAEVVEFDMDGETVPAKRAKVYAIVYHHPAGRHVPEPLCSVVESSGSRWSCREVALREGRIEGTTPSGVKLARPASAVARIDFSRGKIVYLGDLKPESVEWTPYFGLGKELPVRAAFYGPRVDRSTTGGPLELDGKSYKKGLSVHSKTVLVYRLPDRFRRLTATVGIDDRVRPRGHVQLVIRGDDRVLFEAPVSGSDPPRSIDLDVTGVRRITILVDFGADLDIADHLDLCDARLVK
ncbi:MAG: NPCBM/NEW2 domain-containing protein [Thermoguttaceae bacterium]|jgi:hypothetical protein|nr:NPCBM/NEW2 domain-containing protein [Thermoguttaceae bacterium]